MHPLVRICRIKCVVLGRNDLGTGRELHILHIEVLARLHRLSAEHPANEASSTGEHFVLAWLNALEDKSPVGIGSLRQLTAPDAKPTEMHENTVYRRARVCAYHPPRDHSGRDTPGARVLRLRVLRLEFWIRSIMERTDFFQVYLRKN
jgi:hypothetical protein